MSTDNPVPRKYIFVDGLETSHQFQVRSHVSREACRQRRIQKIQAFQKKPVSRLVGWKRRPATLRAEPLAIRLGSRHSDDSSSHTNNVASHLVPLDATLVSGENAVRERRYVVRERGQARRTLLGYRKSNLSHLHPRRQLPPTLLEGHNPLERAIGSWRGRDHGEFASIFAQRDASRRARNHDRSGHKAAGASRRTELSPVLATRMSSANSVCRLGAGFFDPFQDYPVKMDPPTQRILYRLLDNSPSNRFRAYRDAWFAHAVSDSAAFKQFLSTFALFVQRLDPSAAAKLGPLTLTLHAQALHSVNERILSPAVAADEGLLVAIMSFVAHYQLLEKYDAWETHIRGLKDIIRIRGGLEKAFLNKKALRTMLFFVDLQGSWMQDHPPHFPLPLDSLPNLQSLPVSSSILSNFRLAMYMSTIWRARFPQQPAIPDILDDLVIVTAHLISEGSRTAGAIWTDSIATGLWVNPIVHRLLQLRIEKLDCSNCNDVLQESFRIAAMLYLARIKFHTGLISALTRTYVTMLKACLSNEGRAYWMRLEPLKIWILIMGGMDLKESSPERLWFESEILKTAISMNTKQWPKVEAIAKGILWIEDLFHEKSQTLWRELEAQEAAIRQ